MSRTGNAPPQIMWDLTSGAQGAGAQSVTVPVVHETSLVVREVTAAETAELRRAVLRGGQQVPLPGDDEPAFHLGVYRTNQLLGTGNVRPELAPWDPTSRGWRLRGMATVAGARSQGVGGLVLDGLLHHVREQGGGLLWCHARTPAQAFYERAGLQIIGEPWVDPEIGPHVRMWVAL
jgi:GNAT superfamily N-acetyltransferase